MKGPVKIAYIDVLQCLLVVIFVAFIFSEPKKPESKANVIDPSQVLAELVWTDNSNDDVDLWIENPNGEIVYFGTREIGGMTLDTDNLGINNAVFDPKTNELVQFTARREVASVRKAIAGTYTVNVMLYEDRTGLPEKVKVHVMKLNPFKNIIDKEVTLNFKGEEATIVTFELDSEGNIVSQNNEPEPVSLFAKLKP